MSIGCIQRLLRISYRGDSTSVLSFLRRNYARRRKIRVAEWGPNSLPRRTRSVSFILRWD